MRPEKEIFGLIINTAKSDSRIRAAFLSGSRANPNIPKDIFQDYDIIYVVSETASFREDKSWIDIFGERLYMQYPEDSVYFPSDPENCYGWLIQFKDGIRLDLHVCTLKSSMVKDISCNKPYKVLLDKDGCLPKYSNISDSDFWIAKPTEKEFICTCNEFWWCLNNVAKGLWREEIPYVMDMINFFVRPMLIRLLEWKIGFQTNFSVSVGKSGKYMKKWLPAKLWERFLKTYSNAAINEIWDSVFMMCDIVDETAHEISLKTGFSYNSEEANNSREFLTHVKHLPKDAKKI